LSDSPVTWRSRDNTFAPKETSEPSRASANIDISHLVLADTCPSDLAKLKGKAIHVHISDCDGKVHGDRPDEAS
jgi:sugar phosphate isomerase/epimerase